MWEILIFYVISAAEKIQINSKKTRFWKEKSVKGVINTWANVHRPR